MSSKRHSMFKHSNNTQHKATDGFALHAFTLFLLRGWMLVRDNATVAAVGTESL